MTTTSIKLPDAVKERVAAAASAQGVTAHAFMVQAITNAAAQAELRVSFVADAVAAREEACASGLGYDADEVHAYIRQRALGVDAPRPRARPWRG